MCLVNLVLFDEVVGIIYFHKIFFIIQNDCCTYFILRFLYNCLSVSFIALI